MSGIIFSEGSGLNNGLIGKRLAPIKAIINSNVEAFQQKSLIDKIYYMDTSKNWAENYTIETALGNFQDVGEGGATPQSGMQEGFDKTIAPRVWKNKFVVTKEMMDDMKIGKIKSKANQFTTSYGRGREAYAARMLSGATQAKVTFAGKTYDATCADGKPLFSVEHPSKTQGAKFKQSNMFKAEFSQSILDQLQEKMQDFCDDDGNLLNVAPDTIIIPNSAKLKRAVFAAVGSELDPESNKNAMNFQLGLWNILIWPYMDKQIGGRDYVILADSKFLQDYMCLPFIDRVPLTVTRYTDQNTDDEVFKGYARYGLGFNNWRGLCICGNGISSGTPLTA